MKVKVGKVDDLARGGDSASDFKSSMSGMT